MSLSLSFFLSIVCDFSVRTVDFKTTFLNTNRKLTDKQVYFKPPSGVPVKEGFLNVQSMDCRIPHFCDTRRSSKFSRNSDSNKPHLTRVCYTDSEKENTYVIMTMTVDDILFVSKSKATKQQRIS